MRLKFISPENILRKQWFSPEDSVGESATSLSSLFQWLIITGVKMCAPLLPGALVACFPARAEFFVLQRFLSTVLHVRKGDQDT